jgi:hypothetical protein
MAGAEAAKQHGKRPSGLIAFCHTFWALDARSQTEVVNVAGIEAPALECMPVIKNLA